MVQVEMHVQAAQGLIAQLDQVLSLQTYIADDALALADIAIGPMVYRLYKLGLAQPHTCNLFRFLESLEKRPAFAGHVMVGLE